MNRLGRSVGGGVTFAHAPVRRAEVTNAVVMVDVEERAWRWHTPSSPNSPRSAR
ncbi:hypothetical protein [Trueperella pyogenes]|uniref:hypothetical protein n=1 Tax=Trueperella pyogenes TaxID=1661 RepID=UPI00131A7F90|nr:hypothetical protein [Trueperella pyogenes]